MERRRTAVEARAETDRGYEIARVEMEFRSLVNILTIEATFLPNIFISVNIYYKYRI